MLGMFLHFNPGGACAQTSRIGTVVDNFLIPIPLPSGICSDGSSFWIPNYSAVTGGQEIYKLDIWTHKITDSIRSLDRTPTGLAWDGKGIWVTSSYPYNPYVDTYKTSLVRLSTSGSILSYILATYTCYWAGIAWDGRNLYYGTNVCFASDSGQRSMIYKVNPTTGAVIDSFPPPSGNINGLVYDRGHLWYCDDNNGYIFEIDTTGKILYEFPLSGLTFHGPLTGVTVAKGYLWAVDMAGVGGPRIYEIDIGEAPAIPQHMIGYSGSPKEIHISWKPDSSVDIKWYRIYRSLSENSTAAILIDSVHSNVATYTDTTAPNGYFYYYWVSAVDSQGVESHVSNGGSLFSYPEFTYQLYQNYPNPFNSTTIIPYEIPQPVTLSGQEPTVIRHVKITVYDILGRKVETLIDGDVPAGDRSVVFNANGLPSGVYFYKLVSGNYVSTKKMLMIK